MDTFERELEELLKKYGWGKPGMTPAFLVARYLGACLQAYGDLEERLDDLRDRVPEDS